MMLVSDEKNDPGTLKAVFPGKYIQGEKALTELPFLVELLGSRGLILSSPTTRSNVLPKYCLKEREDWIEIETFRGECCMSEVERLEKIMHHKKIDVLVGMGGGKTIDTAKIVADRTNIPVIVVPTIASTDAPCSGCAVVYSEEGVFQSVYYLKMNPQVVLVDLDIIASAPTRFLVAGMGDALATWFEARSCKMSGSANECGGYSTLTALSIARLCYDTLLRFGPAAKEACDQYLVTPQLSCIVEANTLMSGLGFESSGLAAAHSIHNGMTVLEETHAYYHGEKVAFGVLAGLFLTHAPEAEKKTVYGFCEKIGLPTTLADIGIHEIDRERLMAVAVKACVPQEGIHHERVKITPKKVFNAILAADEYGRNRK